MTEHLIRAEVQGALTDLSLWIDGSYPSDLSHEAVDWRRIAKLSEEVGEAINAYAGSIGENPRKGVTHTLTDVCDELLDVALCALGALEHVIGHDGAALEALDRHIIRVATRAGVR